MTSLASIPKCKRPFEILSCPSLESIHSSFLQILEEVGVKFDDERTLRLFAEKSCHIDPTRNTVRIAKGLVDECVKKTPRSFSIHSRRLDEMRIGGEDLYFVSAVDNSHILDNGLHQRRTGKLSDVGEIAKLMDELSFHHICCPAVIAHDVHNGGPAKHQFDPIPQPGPHHRLHDLTLHG